MRVRQGALTVVTRIRAGAEGELRSALARIDEDVEANEWIPFARLSTLHFGRWVILPEVRAATGAVRFPAQLVLSTSFDGPRVNHLEELVRVGRRALDEVYRHC